MGAYLYRVFGKTFDVVVDGQPRPARMCKFWMKPYWEIFDDVLRGTCSFYTSRADKRLFRSYNLQLGKLQSTPAVSLFVLSQHSMPEKPTLSNKPDVGDLVLVFKQDRHYVVDDPNWQGADYLYLRRAGGVWEATKEKKSELVKVP